MFDHLIPVFAMAFLAYSLAFLLVLWLVEKPVLAILAYDQSVEPYELRRVHQTQATYVSMNGPYLLIPGVLGAAICTGLQVYETGVAIIPLAVCLVTIFTLGFVLFRAGGGSRAVATMEFDAPVEEIAAGLRQLVALHYRSLSLVAAATMGDMAGDELGHLTAHDLRHIFIRGIWKGRRSGPPSPLFRKSAIAGCFPP